MFRVLQFSYVLIIRIYYCPTKCDARGQNEASCSSLHVTTPQKGKSFIHVTNYSIRMFHKVIVLLEYFGLFISHTAIVYSTYYAGTYCAKNYASIIDLGLFVCNMKVKISFQDTWWRWNNSYISLDRSLGCFKGKACSSLINVIILLLMCIAYKIPANLVAYNYFIFIIYTFSVCCQTLNVYPEFQVPLHF